MKDILLFDDPQKDEFIEFFKTPPIPPIEFTKIRKRQANDYILANTSPWTDCFYLDKLLYERAHFSAPRRGEPEVLKPPKDNVVGVWTDKCGICHQRKPCTDLHHDWNPPKEGAAK